MDLFREVVGFVFVCWDIGVASEAEGGVGRDFFAGKKSCTEVGDEVLEEDKAAFVDESSARNGGGEGENDDALIGPDDWIENGKGEADIEGRDDLARIFGRDQKG